VRAVVQLTSQDPWSNLATERVLFEHLGEDDHCLLLWRNSPCVVIGRHQNPWLECDLLRMKEDSVPLVRRISGGGAVYHELGNTNFSFMGAAGLYDLDRQFAVVLAALHALGIPAERNARNDLVIPGPGGPRKFSGNAFRHTRDHSLHHGTLLVHADLERLTAYLAAPPAAITSKSITSVRSSVVNLAELRSGLTHDELAASLADGYAREFGPLTHGGPGLPELPRSFGDAELSRAREELLGRAWRIGKTPHFTRVVDTGAGAFEVSIRHGRVERVDPPGENRREGAASLSRLLEGAWYAGEELRARATDTTAELRRCVDAIAEGVP
jgi:lipoate-protein ligase A